MRSFLIALFMLALFGASYAQNPVIDERPETKIYIIDAQTGQETPATSDFAVLFKNALLDLVRDTRRSKAILHGAVPQSEGRLYTVTQFGVETNINGFQISLDYQTNDPNQPANVYTFAYHADDNTLYFYDTATQQWLLERIGADNTFNLRRTTEYSQKFNAELANQQNGQPGIGVTVDLNAPVDVDVVADTAPPAMPDYEQPECPSDGYLWQPGYWAYTPYRNDYYWVPGTWVAPPSPGVLWTPPYWGYEGSRFVFHVGYWGDHVGFYGGINYGYGYGGRGYYGGEWRGGRFNYNTAVVRVNTTVVHNTYINKTVINNVVVNNHNSFNGRGGVEVTPSPEEISASREHHLKPTPEQNSNQLAARGNPNQFHNTNPGGKPVFAAPKAMLYHPQNNPGIKGANNLKQPITPVKPQGQPAATAQPAGLAGAPAKPQAKPAIPVKPQGQPASPAKPDGLPGAPKPQVQPTVPVKPQGQPTTPGKPDGLPGTPKPQVQPTVPVKPQGQPTTPAKPDGVPGTPKPQVQPTVPVKPQGQPTTPAKPDGLPGTPKPQVQPTNPAKPRVQPTTPASPTGLPGQPAKTNPPVKPKPKPKVTPPATQPTPPAQPTKT